jgi:MerR family transcriptional regulator, heat shock protein HspR
MNTSGTQPDRTPVYVISVAARLLDVHPQTLRNYERAGFLRPTRTEGKRRLYSVEDIEQLRRLIGTVEQFGLNLTGLRMVLAVREELTFLRQVIEMLPPDATTDATSRIERMLNLLEGNDPALFDVASAEEAGAAGADEAR